MVWCILSQEGSNAGIRIRCPQAFLAWLWPSRDSWAIFVKVEGRPTHTSKCLVAASMPGRLLVTASVLASLVLVGGNGEAFVGED